MGLEAVVAAGIAVGARGRLQAKAIALGEASDSGQRWAGSHLGRCIVLVCL